MKYKKLTAMTHRDRCENHLKTIHRANANFNDEETRENYDRWGFEKAEDELSRMNNWIDSPSFADIHLKKKLFEIHLL